MKLTFCRIGSILDHLSRYLPISQVKKKAIASGRGLESRPSPHWWLAQRPRSGSRATQTAGVISWEKRPLSLAEGAVRGRRRKSLLRREPARRRQRSWMLELTEICSLSRVRVLPRGGRAGKSVFSAVDT